MGYFDTVLSPPDWLTQQYVEDALRKYEGDSLLKVNIRFYIILCICTLTLDTHFLLDHQLLDRSVHETWR